MNNKYNNIVIPIDLAHESSWRNALPIAIEQAQSHGARLHLVTVVPNTDIPAVAVHLPDDIDKRLRHQGILELEALASEHVPVSVETSFSAVQGRIHKEILHIAKKVDADLIVMASHHPELKSYLIGANAAHVVRHADCSVLVVRNRHN